MEQDEARAERLLGLYERMLVIRQAETRLAKLFNDGKIPGFIHLSIGQEATAVGVAAALGAEDTVASTHRGHGHSLAKGMAPRALFHEILGNEEGACRGRGGSLHVADFSVGMLGANGIVAGGVSIALGSALAHKTLANNRVAAVFFGDGALAEGVLYETMNLAALWSLPLLLVCENNGWSEFSPTSTQFAGKLENLAGTFTTQYRHVDGNDVEAVFAAAQEMVSDLRAGRGPAVLECFTKRVKGHYEGDPQRYRDGAEEREAQDPIEVALNRLSAAGVAATKVDGVAEQVGELIEAAAVAASQGTVPAPETALADVYS